MSAITETQKRALGQRLVVGFHGSSTEPSEHIKSLIRAPYFVGNVIIMKRNISSLPQIQTLIHKLQLIAHEAGHEQPLGIGIDQEGGLVSAFSSTANKDAGTQFPGAMALGAAHSPQLTEQVNEAMARELKDIAGINWCYGPVGDVNTNPKNPVIGVRSFGDDPGAASVHVQAAVSGLQKQDRVAACVKHFPGHGDTHVDSHLGLPVITKSLDELKKTELLPFQGAVSHAASIMTAHISLPNAFGEGDEPASISPAVTQYLRKTMRYEGVIVTDCLEMGGVTDYCGTTESAAVKSILAGADIAMICHTFSAQEGALKGLWTAFGAENIPEQDMKESLGRIRQMKDRFIGSWDAILSRPVKDEPDIKGILDEHKKLSEGIYENCLAVVSDPRGMLPISRPSETPGSILLYVPILESVNYAVDDSEGVLRTKDNLIRNTAGPSYEAFKRSLAKRGKIEQTVYTPGYIFDKTKVDSCDAVVFVTRNASRGDGWQNKVLSSLLEMIGSTKLVVLSSCDPFDIHKTSMEKEAAYLCTFEYTARALETAAKVMFGEIQCHGKVPVRYE